MAPPALPSVQLNVSPKGPQFAISADAVMPAITVEAVLVNFTLAPNAPPIYNWTVGLEFNGATCVHGSGVTTAHDAIGPIVGPAKYLIPFTQVRGGTLVVSVRVQAGAQVATGTTSSLTIVGSNPTIGKIAAVANTEPAFRKLMRLESGLRQFLANGSPQFSGDDKGGVGLCQLTYPAPTADQIWNWKANVNAGWQLFRAKRNAAKAYPEKMRSSDAFRSLVSAFNDSRLIGATPPGFDTLVSPVRPKLAGPSAAFYVPISDDLSQPMQSISRPPPLVITLPDFTDEQLARDTLRGFNGWAGGLHEYRVKVDAKGMLVVTLNAAGNAGTAEWERVTAEDRIAYYDKISLPAANRGDPNYVDDVESLPGF